MEFCVVLKGKYGRIVWPTGIPTTNYVRGSIGRSSAFLKDNGAQANEVPQDGHISKVPRQENSKE